MILGDLTAFQRFGHYAGYHVEKGCAPRRERGTRITWNPKVRALGYKIGKSFVMHGGGYEKWYREFKMRYLTERPELTRGHIDAMARRKTVKLFLAHLWHVWRTLENLPVTSPNPSLKGDAKILPFIDTSAGPKLWSLSLSLAKAS